MMIQKLFFYILITLIMTVVYNISLIDLINPWPSRREHSYNPNLKYILQWTNPDNYPFIIMAQGQRVFIERNCTFVNCFVTSNRSYLGDYTKFDVIAFAGPDIRKLINFPKRRSPHQKYAFGSMESADNYPMCTNKFDGFFNWTWTYRLTSEVRWGFVTVRDKNNTIIGPNEIMHWKRIADMDPVSPELKEELKTKSKAAAWFASNCYTRSHREHYVKVLRNELMRYDLDVDVYGNCGFMNCSRDISEVCHDMIKRDYYFYLAFENSFSEDYVTEKLLRALNFNAIPIVYGGANYTRFMPDGIYLNAREYKPAHLASKMNELIQNPDQYSQFFRWRNHYTYHRKRESIETDQYCLFCSWLNDEARVKETTIYEHFRDWWDPAKRCRSHKLKKFYIK